MILSPEMSRFLTPSRNEEAIGHEFYDFHFNADLHRFTLFSRCRGQHYGHSQISLLETNMDLACCLPSGQRFGVNFLDFKVGYESLGKEIGSCPKCGAPISDSPKCQWCDSKLPSLSVFDGSIHGSFEFVILDKIYRTGKINGPVAHCDFSIPLPIPSQCNFRVIAEFDRPVKRLNAVLGGILIRPVC